MERERRGFDHERLQVYQRSLELVEAADRLAPRFTGVRKHLGLQLHRAASSVSLNIAEANGRFYAKDKARILVIAIGSALECAAILDIADRLHIGPSDERAEMRQLLDAIVPMLIKLTRNTRARQPK